MSCIDSTLAGDNLSTSNPLSGISLSSLSSGTHTDSFSSRMRNPDKEVVEDPTSQKSRSRKRKRSAKKKSVKSPRMDNSPHGASEDNAGTRQLKELIPQSSYADSVNAIIRFYNANRSEFINLKGYDLKFSKLSFLTLQGGSGNLFIFFMRKVY